MAKVNTSSAFAELKRNRQALTDKLKSELEKSKTTYTEDDRYWSPTVDKAGNGYAVIRFLPGKHGEDVSFVKLWSHAFQGPGGWYIENCRSTLGTKENPEKDPVNEYNSILWNSGIEKNKEIARKQKRKLTFISNIYVVEDPGNPDNEGKVFLFKYGKKIYDKINDMMFPQFADEKPVNVFDLWEGANFKLKIRNVDDYRNYDKSSFTEPDVLLDDEEELEKIYNSVYSLKELVSPDKFKTYDELKARLNRVLNLDETAAPSKKSISDNDESEAPKHRATKAAVVDDDDDDLEMFKRLAEED